MGEIINQKISGDKIIYRLELTEAEAIQLRSHMRNVHLFSSDLNTHPVKIIERGNKRGVKYFVIPLSLKSRKRKKYTRVSYQKLEINEKVFYISVVEKDYYYKN